MIIKAIIISKVSFLAGAFARPYIKKFKDYITGKDFDDLKKNSAKQALEQIEERNKKGLSYDRGNIS